MSASLTPARLSALIAVAAALAGVAALIGLCTGSSAMSPADALGGLAGTGDPVSVQIVRAVRLPTVALAALAGAYLGAGGAAMQGMLRNPLADPYILGISGGAALGVSACVVLGVHRVGGISIYPLAAFAGALGATALIYAVASVLPGGLRGKGAIYSLLLTGVIFNALAGALILLMYAILTPLQAQELLFWLMGTVEPGRADGADIAVAAMLGAGAVLGLTALAHRLNVLALGDTTATTLGVDVASTRRIIFFLTSIAVGAAVAYTGLIGFVGLVVPHMVRLRIGGDHRALIPVSALIGGAFLILADALARTLFPVAGTSVPVGSVTAILGAPLFLALLVRHLRAGGQGE